MSVCLCVTVCLCESERVCFVTSRGPFSGINTDLVKTGSPHQRLKPDPNEAKCLFLEVLVKVGGKGVT